MHFLLRGFRFRCIVTISNMNGPRVSSLRAHCKLGGAGARRRLLPRFGFMGFSDEALFLFSAFFTASSAVSLLHVRVSSTCRPSLVGGRPHCCGAVMRRDSSVRMDGSWLPQPWTAHNPAKRDTKPRVPYRITKLRARSIDEVL